VYATSALFAIDRRCRDHQALLGVYATSAFFVHICIVSYIISVIQAHYKPF